VVQAAYHALVRLYHPDVGGDHDRAVAINAAAALIREHLERSA
jgi:curved DNA-binding protein CbpA